MTRFKHKIICLCLLAFIMIFMSACNSGTTEETGGETNKEPIKIGVLASEQVLWNLMESKQ